MSRGLMVLSLQKKAVVSRTKKRVWTVKETDLVLFTRQLATMIEAGISLVQALTALYEQSDPKRQRNLRHVISDVIARVQGGETFNESIAKHPRVFNRLFVSMVKQVRPADCWRKFWIVWLAFSKRALVCAKK